MRREDWVARLWQTVQAYEHTPFNYEAHHCGLFAARCVDAITGSTWADEMPTGAREAIEFLTREGRIEAAVTRRLGESVPGHNARRGDICLIDAEGGPGLGICLGPTIAVLSAAGLEFQPLARAHKHWRVD